MKNIISSPFDDELSMSGPLLIFIFWKYLGLFLMKSKNAQTCSFCLRIQRVVSLKPGNGI